MGTIYKLVLGGIVLLLLLMTLLPTPRDPVQQDFSARLAFPLVASGHVLGADGQGRDVLSRLMSGGRFLLFRLAIVGLIVAGVTVLVRHRLASAPSAASPTSPCPAVSGRSRRGS